MISRELLPEDYQKFENFLISADQMMLGDKNFNKNLLACQTISKRVVQWQLSILFWYAPRLREKTNH